MSDNQFHGEGFDPGEFSETERRKHRHMYAELNENFRKMDERTFKTLETGAAAIRGMQILAAIGKFGWPLGLGGFVIGVGSKLVGWI